MDREIKDGLTALKVVLLVLGLVAQMVSVVVVLTESDYHLSWIALQVGFVVVWLFVGMDALMRANE